ncbi:MAG: glycosyltransferase [Rhodospirillaceae bacterium]|nr:glycosyltransferase [Rhodospirillaceae bacterium]
MTKMVCIVSPGNLASNPRLVKEADALHGAGYDVTAVACDYSEELRSTDDEIAARVPWTVVRVPRPLGERAVTLAARRLARMVAATGAAVPAGLAARATGGPISTLRRAVRGIRADLYIAHYVAGLAAVTPVARQRGAMLGFDAEDFHSGEGTGGAGEDFRMKLIETIERAALPSCAHATASSPMIAQAYAGRYGIAPTAVLNVFPLGMAPAAPQPGDPTRLKAYWFSQTIGLDRGLQPFLQAMARTRSRVTLDIRGGNQWGGGDRLMAVARDLGVADRVSILPKASPDEMVTLAATYDVGLSLETAATENHQICLGNKIFTYLLAGVPVMLSDTRAQRELAPALGAGGMLVSLSDPETIAAALDGLGETPSRLAEAKRTAWRLGRERYNWDVEKDFLLKAVDRAFALRGPGKAVR